MRADQVLEAFGAALAAGDALAAANLFAPDAVYDEPPRFHFQGRAAIHDFIADFAARHTGVSFTVSRSLIAPDNTLLAAEWRWAYTRLDGTPHAFTGMCFATLRDGLIAHWRGVSVAAPQR